VCSHRAPAAPGRSATESAPRQHRSDSFGYGTPLCGSLSAPRCRVNRVTRDANTATALNDGPQLDPHLDLAERIATWVKAELRRRQFACLYRPEPAAGELAGSEARTQGGGAGFQWVVAVEVELAIHAHDHGLRHGPRARSGWMVVLAQHHGQVDLRLGELVLERYLRTVWECEQVVAGAAPLLKSRRAPVFSHWAGVSSWPGPLLVRPHQAIALRPLRRRLALMAPPAASVLSPAAPWGARRVP